MNEVGIRGNQQGFTSLSCIFKAEDCQAMATIKAAD
jgi:hypothetical protein